ncbi:MAG: aldehyde dehydrogenase family protein [bacterium]|nr:aldehyde dehydrogenase family protein [bacterium]
MAPNVIALTRHPRPVHPALDAPHNRAVFESAKLDHEQGKLPAYFPTSVYSLVGSMRSRVTQVQSTPTKQWINPNDKHMVVPVICATDEEVLKAIAHAKAAANHVAKMDGDALAGIVLDLAHTYQATYETGDVESNPYGIPPTLPAEHMVVSGICSGKKMEEQEHALLEGAQVHHHELMVTRMAHNDPNIRLEIPGIDTQWSCSNFSMLTLRALYNAAATKTPVIVVANKKVSPTDFAYVTWLKQFTDTLHPGLLQLIVPASNEQAAKLLRETDSIHFVGSPATAKAIRAAGQTVFTVAETGGKGNHVLVDIRTAPMGEVVKDMSYDGSYAQGMQCSRHQVIAVQGNKDTFDAFTYQLAAELRTTPVVDSVFEAGASALTGTSPALPDGPGNKEIYLGIEGEQTNAPHSSKPRLFEVDLEAPEKWAAEAWAPVTRVGHLPENTPDAVLEIATEMGKLGTLTSGYYVDPSQYRNVFEHATSRGRNINMGSMRAAPPAENFGGIPERGTATGTTRSVGADAIQEFTLIKVNHPHVQQTRQDAGKSYAVPNDCLRKSITEDDIQRYQNMRYRQDLYAQELEANNPVFYESSPRYVYQGMERKSERDTPVLRVDHNSDLVSVLAVLDQSKQLGQPIRVSIEPTDNRFDTHALEAHYGITVHRESVTECTAYLTAHPRVSVVVDSLKNINKSLRAYVTKTDSEVFPARDADAATVAQIFGRLIHVKIPKESTKEQLDAFHRAAAQTDMWMRPTTTA